jgi:hypothetical protein
MLIAIVVSAALVLPGWQERQGAEFEEELQLLTEQEVAEVRAAVEKQTGMPVRYVWRNRQGVVEAFAGGEHRGRAAYQVKKTDEGWKVIATFDAFSA